MLRFLKKITQKSHSTVCASLSGTICNANKKRGNDPSDFAALNQPCMRLSKKNYPTSSCEPHLSGTHLNASLQK